MPPLASAPAPVGGVGPLGRHAARGGAWTRPAPWVYAVGTLAWFLLVLRQYPCVTNPAHSYGSGCYSDIDVLWYWRGIAEGRVPYVEADLEYPVLTGQFIWVTRLLAGLVPVADVRLAYLGVTAVALFGCFLGLLAVHLRMGRPWDALMLAASPLIVASGFINWDLLPILLTSGALLAWARGRPGWAGVLIGLGTAAKLYPLLLLVPIGVLCLRTGRWSDLARTAAGAAASWLAVNLPVYLATPDGWLRFWSFNVERGGDLGSIWYMLGGLGADASRLSLVVAAVMVVGALAIAALLMLAPQRPRLAAGAFLIVALFCLANKVYSPQYMLWLLPLVVLARPVWRDWAIFTVGELVYWWAVWTYLDGNLYAGDGQPRMYWAAIILRIGTQLWVVALVVRDALLPAHDPVRRWLTDDPGGGVLNGVPDARVLGRRWAA